MQECLTYGIINVCSSQYTYPYLAVFLDADNIYDTVFTQRDTLRFVAIRKAELIRMGNTTQDPLSSDVNKRTIRFLQPEVLNSVTTDSATLKFIAPWQIKTRTGCMQCKKRKVKCDEALPRCSRCVARKEACTTKSRTSKWQGRTITFEQVEKTSKKDSLARTEDSILNYWFENGCQVMSIEPVTSNPFSFPLLESLSKSESLFHLVRSLSLANRANYETSQMAQSFEERGLALVALQKEIKNKSVPCGLLLLSTLFLGISSPWINGNPSDFGIIHLFAISAMINKAFAYGIGLTDKMFYLAIGLYIYWDMACSFLTRFNQALPLREELFQVAIDLSTKRLPHPVTGIATQLIYILGKIGRYQRQVLDTKQRNIDQENLLEAQLTDWKMPPAERELQHIAECYRLTGFIMLYSAKGDGLYDARITLYAERVVDMLDEIPTNSPRVNFQGLVLMIVGGEITDPRRRAIVLARFQALYQIKKLQVNLHGAQLVKEVWALRAQGTSCSMLSVMRDHGWHIMLG